MFMKRAFLFTIVLFSSPPAFAAGEPMAVVKELVDAIRSFEQAEKGKALTPAQVAKNDKVIQKAHGTLDIDGLARRSLGDTWGELEGRQQKEFINLLKQIFADVAYPQSAKFFGALDLEFDDAGERRGKHVIALAVSHPEEGLIDIDFFLSKVGEAWKVVDIHLDGVSLALDIRSQMQRAINDGGYQNLVKKMKAKIDESEA